MYMNSAVKTQAFFLSKDFVVNFRSPKRLCLWNTEKSQDKFKFCICHILATHPHSFLPKLQIKINNNNKKPLLLVLIKLLKMIPILQTDALGFTSRVRYKVEASLMFMKGHCSS